jgi:two-component system LytT family sensor kinase
LAWRNSGALVIYGLRDLGVAPPPPLLTAFAFSALGFLPAVVVHSAFPNDARSHGGAWSVVTAAYVVSTVASVMQVRAALHHDALPWRPAMVLLTIGYLAILALLVVYSSRQPAVRRALSAVALAAFAVMALHLGQHATSTDTWPIELVGHHASLPLALVILYQDYRFALADLFLKRALTLLALIGIWMALYVAFAVPYVLPHMAGDWTQPVGVGALLAMGIATALAYPTLRAAVNRFVDRVVLRRADYRQVRAQLTGSFASLDSPNDVMRVACESLGPALSASRVSWRDADDTVLADWRMSHVGRAPGASIRVPTTDDPAYIIDIGPLTGGRRLMSDDMALLERVAIAAARRIDSIRVSDERYTRDLREREMLQLATQAELKALRAQLNPHFLFNALTTIGQLIQEAPDRAVTTLFRLTALLRAVLRRADGEFTTVADEIQIVRAYLDIERARFEDALHVSIDMDDAVRSCRIPSLLLQPLAENAVKHGIAPRLGGGAVSIDARAEMGDDEGHRPTALVLTVRDTGVGVAPPELAQRRATGIGLSTVARRLERCYGSDASLEIHSTPDVGTTVIVRLPLPSLSTAGAA